VNSRLVLAVGDVQCAARKLRQILAHSGLLDPNGMLRPNVHLVFVGDYFDFGNHQQRSIAAVDGIETLAWLSGYGAEQVTLLLGNHDLARIGEFVSMSDERFDSAIKRAARIYGQPARAAEEAEFLADFPEFATAELVARDFSSFVSRQRELVSNLVRSRRLRLAASIGDMLFCHAGVTSEDLALLGCGGGTAQEAAEALNGALDAALDAWNGTSPFAIPGLHTPGSRANGEGGGILYHRAANPALRQDGYEGPGRRRYDPRRIPIGIVQVIGHVRDAKSRQLLGDWVEDSQPTREGNIRGLVTDGNSVSYRDGFPRTGADIGSIVFIDGGMHHCAVEDYRLLDVAARAAFPSVASVHL